MFPYIIAGGRAVTLRCAAVHQQCGTLRQLNVLFVLLNQASPGQGIKKETTTAQIEIGLTLHKMLALLAHQQLSGDESRSNRTMIKQIADYIRAHYAEPINLDMLLAQIPVSKSWFLRLFRQYMGTTPYNFLLSTRITRAKELLVLTDFPVGEVARQVGFEDESNFSTRFSSMTGQSPQQYRKSALKPFAQNS